MKRAGTVTGPRAAGPSTLSPEKRVPSRPAPPRRQAAESRRTRGPLPATAFCTPRARQTKARGPAFSGGLLFPPQLLPPLETGCVRVCSAQA